MVGLNNAPWGGGSKLNQFGKQGGSCDPMNWNKSLLSWFVPIPHMTLDFLGWYLFQMWAYTYKSVKLGFSQVDLSVFPLW